MSDPPAFHCAGSQKLKTERVVRQKRGCQERKWPAVQQNGWGRRGGGVLASVPGGSPGLQERLALRIISKGKKVQALNAWLTLKKKKAKRMKNMSVNFNVTLTEESTLTSFNRSFLL